MTITLTSAHHIRTLLTLHFDDGRIQVLMHLEQSADSRLKWIQNTPLFSLCALRILFGPLSSSQVTTNLVFML